MVQGWVWHAWAIENDGWMQFKKIKRDCKGYVAQEIEKLMAQAHGKH